MTWFKVVYSLACFVIFDFTFKRLRNLFARLVKDQDLTTRCPSELVSDGHLSHWDVFRLNFDFSPLWHSSFWPQTHCELLWFGILRAETFSVCLLLLLRAQASIPTLAVAVARTVPCVFQFTAWGCGPLRGRCPDVRFWSDVSLGRDQPPGSGPSSWPPFPGSSSFPSSWTPSTIWSWCSNLACLATTFRSSSRISSPTQARGLWTGASFPRTGNQEWWRERVCPLPPLGSQTHAF